MQHTTSQMDIVCNKNLVVCFFAILSSAIAKGICSNNASCIALEDCRCLNTMAQEQLNDSLINLLEKLYCGFGNGKIPMVCCPPQFKKEIVINRAKNHYNPMDLLPDLNVCGNQINDGLGWTRTDIDEHPWIALLRYDKRKGSGFYCGGVLIASRYVLTAAHCVKGADIPKSWKLSQVRLGEWNVTSKKDCDYDYCSPPVIDVPIEEVIAHEDYNPTDDHQQNDIALLRLARQVEFNDFVQPICLPISPELRNNTFIGYTMEVAGWGLTESRSRSDVKLKGRVSVINRKECQDVYTRVGRTITEKQLCTTGLRGQDSCRGDSGGPLLGQVPSLRNWMAIGVMSYGPHPCGTPGWPSVNTRVTEYIDWILSNIRP